MSSQSPFEAMHELNTLCVSTGTTRTKPQTDTNLLPVLQNAVEVLELLLLR